MRKDLAERLRAIVRQTPAVSRADVAAAVRELGVEPDVRATPAHDLSRRDLEGIAEALGGRVEQDADAHCIVIDYVYESSRSHGRWTIDASMPSRTAPLELFDRDTADASEWTAKPVFFDTETTGLSGGAGTIAFLVGCGWFEPGGFRVRQWLLTSQAGERMMLRALGRAVDHASLLVSYNGRTFDVPLMEMRWAFHREASPFDDVPHFDLLPTARRLWSKREGAFDEISDAGCSLSTLERDVLGFVRHDDVPGFDIPARYFQFLRTGDPRVLDGVLLHHRHDIVSLAVLMAHALRLAEHGPDMCRTDHEVVALGRVYERAGAADRARAAFERAAQSADRYVRAHACARLGVLHRRDGRHDEAARAWTGVLEAAGGRRSLFALERAATEALAIHHEHRAQDLDAARRYAESLKQHANGRAAGAAAHRLARLARKQGAGEPKPRAYKQKGGPKAAPLLDE